MSPQTIKFIITAVLFLHGLAHGNAFLSLPRQAGGSKPVLPVRSWLIPSLSPRTAAIVAGFFWLLSAIGFVVAGLSFWGALLPGSDWRQYAVLSAIISTAGIILFSGIWPGAPNRRLSNIDTVIALVVNIAIFVTLLWVQWPPYDMFGK
jgi:hypothetical protein